MKLRQYIPALALMLAILGMLITPGITSAFLICDPCCSKKKSIQAERTGREIAISYANAGTHFFQGLIALENSNTAAEKKLLTISLSQSEKCALHSVIVLVK